MWVNSLVFKWCIVDNCNLQQSFSHRSFPALRQMKYIISHMNYESFSANLSRVSVFSLWRALSCTHHIFLIGKNKRCCCSKLTAQNAIKLNGERELKYQLCRNKYGYNIIRVWARSWNKKNNGIKEVLLVYLELPEHTVRFDLITVELILVAELTSGRHGAVKCPLRMHTHLACSNEADPRKKKKNSSPIALYPPKHHYVQQRHEISLNVVQDLEQKKWTKKHYLHFKHEQLA